MANIRKVSVNRFDGGVQNSARSTNFTGAEFIKNFNVYDDMHKLKPVPSWKPESTESEKRYKIQSLTSYFDARDEVYVYGAGVGTTNWYGRGWQYRIKVELQSGQVNNSPFYYLNLADMPSTFWNNVQDDGSDIQITDFDNNVLPRFLSFIDTTNEEGLIYGVPSSGFYVYFGNENVGNEGATDMYGGVPFSPTIFPHYFLESTTTPADYGYRVFLPFDNEVNTSTINEAGADALFNAPTVSYLDSEFFDTQSGYGFKSSYWAEQSDGKFGRAFFANEIRTQSSGASSVSLGSKFYGQFWYKTPVSGQDRQIFFLANGFTVSVNSSNQIEVSVETSGGASPYVATSSTTVTDDTYYFIQYWYDESSFSGVDINIYVNGVSDASESAGGTYSAITENQARVGDENAANQYIDEFILHNNVPTSADSLLQMYNMYENGTTVWSIGDVENESDGNTEGDQGVALFRKQAPSGEWEPVNLFGLTAQSLTNKDGDEISLVPGGFIYDGTYWYIPYAEGSTAYGDLPSGVRHNYAATGSNANWNFFLSQEDYGAMTTDVIGAFGAIQLADYVTGRTQSLSKPIISYDNNYYIPRGNLNLFPQSDIENIEIPTFTIFGGGYAATNHQGYIAVAGSRLGVAAGQLWNLADTVAENIDLGTGVPRVVASVGGSLVFVVDNFIQSEDVSGNDPYIDIYQYVEGGTGLRILRYPVPANMDGQLEVNELAAVSSMGIKYGDIHVFYAKIPGDSARSFFREGLWCVGKAPGSDQVAFTLLYDTDDEGYVTDLTSIGNLLYIASNFDGSVYRLGNDYNRTSIYESLFIGTDNPGIDKQLRTFRVTFEPLEQGQTISGYYKRPTDSNWTKIFEESGESVMEHTSGIIESSGDPLPHFEEIQFKIESAGGSAAITSWSATYEEELDIHE